MTAATTPMAAAIELARLGRGHVEPNPMVGCVLTRDNQIVGRGYHGRFGGPHAEVHAIADAGDAARGATAYVTLEPCCHTGKTPPCTRALIQAGIAKVIVGTLDPFPKVDGGGVRQLRQAGIEVEVGCLEEECRNLIAPFAHRVRTSTPWVRAKWAMSLDGRIATRTGSSQWITGAEARADVHRSRACCDGILVGMGTVRADNPALTARPDRSSLKAGHQHSLPTDRVLHRMVLCRRSVPGLDSNLVRTMDQAPLILVAGPGVMEESLSPLERRGVQVHRQADDDLPAAAVRIAGEIGMTHLIVEGGGQILGSFFDARLVQQCDVYVGGKIIGGHDAPGPVGGTGIADIDDAPQFRCTGVQPLGNDVKMIYAKRPRTLVSSL